ncbi:MAG: response regulator [Pseudohongiellaceae bacterium]
MAGIVVVDDSPARNAVLSAMLRAAGHRVETAATLPGALRQCRCTEPALVLVELLLRHGNGYSLAGFLQRRTGVPAALMVSRQQAAEIRWARARGLAGVLTRPRPVAVMQNRVAELLATQEETG